MGNDGGRFSKFFIKLLKGFLELEQGGFLSLRITMSRSIETNDPVPDSIQRFYKSSELGGAPRPTMDNKHIRYRAIISPLIALNTFSGNLKGKFLCKRLGLSLFVGSLIA